MELGKSIGKLVESSAIRFVDYSLGKVLSDCISVGMWRSINNHVEIPLNSLIPLSNLFILQTVYNNGTR